MEETDIKETGNVGNMEPWGLGDVVKKKLQGFSDGSEIALMTSPPKTLETLKDFVDVIFFG